MILSLYIKTHNITGLKYFGKTIKNPFKYKGSGKYWKRHLSKHGNDVTTNVVATFDNEKDASVFAIEFSLKNNIVDDKSWANLIVENAKDGMPIGHKGHIFTEDQKLKMSASSKEFWAKDGIKETMSDLQIQSYKDGRKVTLPEWTEERKIKHSEVMKAYSNENTNYGFLDYVHGERTEDHCKNISKSLSGKHKSFEHICSLAWNKITKKSPHIKELFENYNLFVEFCYDKIEAGLTVSEIAENISVGRGAVLGALKKSIQPLTIVSQTKGLA